jgi:phosphatidyl-myo-inositol dimannoside synthase
MSKDSKRQKYLLFTLEFPPQKGGVSKYYENLAKNWPDDNFSILTDGQVLAGVKGNVKRARLINAWIRPRWLPSLFHLYRNAKEKHVVVGHILPLGIAAYWLSKLINLEYSIVLHGLDFSLSLKKGGISKAILSRAKNIICANSHTASQVKSFDSSLSNKISVVNPGLAPNFIRHPAKVAELRNKHSLVDKKIVLGFGRLVKRKGFDKVIEAWPEIIAAEKDALLVIGGKGPDETRLKELSLKLPREAASKIIFTGFIADDEYWAWLELCDIFIMTSRDIAGDYEGFGIVYLEANLAGKPVVAGNSGGVRDAVIDNVTGLLVEPEDAKDIAKKVIRLLSDEKLRFELGSAGNRRVVETMSAKKQAEKFYKALLNEKI